MDVGYKNGITNYTVEKRYLRDMDRIEVLQTVEFENGRDARRFETNVLAAFWQYRYLGLPIFKSGWTEMFNRDVMGLDTSLTFVLS